MHAWRVVAAVVAWSVFAAPAYGQSAPTGVLDLGWGTTLDTILSTYPDAQCLAVRTDLSDWRCILSDASVNAIDVDVVFYGYSIGTALGLVGVVLGFDSSDVQRIVEILMARYGRWSRMVEQDFVTKAERPFPSAIWLWHLPDVEIRVEENRGTLGHGQATIMWVDGLNELRAREGAW
jgi:hypothetical protein